MKNRHFCIWTPLAPLLDYRHIEPWAKKSSKLAADINKDASPELPIRFLCPVNIAFPKTRVEDSDLTNTGKVLELSDNLGLCMRGTNSVAKCWNDFKSDNPDEETWSFVYLPAPTVFSKAELDALPEPEPGVVHVLEGEVKVNATLNHNIKAPDAVVRDWKVVDPNQFVSVWHSDDILKLSSHEIADGFGSLIDKLVKEKRVKVRMVQRGQGVFSGSTNLLEHVHDESMTREEYGDFRKQ